MAEFDKFCDLIIQELQEVSRRNEDLSREISQKQDRLEQKISDLKDSFSEKTNEIEKDVKKNETNIKTHTWFIRAIMAATVVAFIGGLFGTVNSCASSSVASANTSITSLQKEVPSNNLRKDATVDRRGSSLKLAR